MYCVHLTQLVYNCIFNLIWSTLAIIYIHILKIVSINGWNQLNNLFLSKVKFYRAKDAKLEENILC